jgi:hypothetical protein
MASNATPSDGYGSVVTLGKLVWLPLLFQLLGFALFVEHSTLFSHHACADRSARPRSRVLSDKRYGATVNFPELVAVPPEVVIAILPVFAPVGTVAVIWV